MDHAAWQQTLKTVWERWATPELISLKTIPVLGDPAEYHNFLIRRKQELKAKLKVMVFDPQLVGPPINGWRK